MRSKAFQAKMISDESMLLTVHRLSHTGRMYYHEAHNLLRWVMNYEVEAEYPWMPFKVVLAKLRALHKRKLLDGCPCGCRGDWYLTHAGNLLIADRLRTALTEESNGQGSGT